jgi:hypothetical protein
MESNNIKRESQGNLKVRKIIYYVLGVNEEVKNQLTN